MSFLLVLMRESALLLLIVQEEAQLAEKTLKLSKIVAVELAKIISS